MEKYEISQIDEILNTKVRLLYGITSDVLRDDMDLAYDPEFLDFGLKIFRHEIEPRQRAKCLTYGVKITEKQFPGLYRLCRYASSCFDMDAPQFFVVNHKVGNDGLAFSVGLKNQGIVALSPMLLNLLNPLEVLNIIGHEIGHLLNQDSAEGFRGNLVIDEFMKAKMVGDKISEELMMMAWHAFEQSQKREMLADRAGLLCCQNLESSQKALLKMILEDRELAELVNIKEFIREHNLAAQSKRIKKEILMEVTHPFNPRRLIFIKDFYESYKYQTIIEDFGYEIKT